MLTMLRLQIDEARSRMLTEISVCACLTASTTEDEAKAAAHPHAFKGRS